MRRVEQRQHLVDHVREGLLGRALLASSRYLLACCLPIHTLQSRIEEVVGDELVNRVK